MIDAIPGARVATVVDLVAERFGVSARALVGRGRTPRIARPRHWAMWLAHEATSYSLVCIGRHIGARHHTTVLHGVRRIAELIAADPDADAEADELFALLRARTLRLQPERTS